MREGLLAYPLLFLPYYTRKTGSTSHGICSLLQATARSGCSDPRDRIYALLGICDAQLSRQVTPNYLAPVSNIFEDFFVKFIEEYHSLDLLQFCCFKTRHLDLPSWVPDLTSLTIRPPQGAFAGGSSRAHADLVRPGTLQVFGLQSTQVRAVSDLAVRSVPMSLMDSFQLIKTWHTFAGEHISNLDQPEFSEAFITAITYGWVHERRSVGTSAKEYFDEFLRLLAIADVTEAELGRSFLLQGFTRDTKDAEMLCTSDGKLGLGPLGTKRGKYLFEAFC